MSLGKLLRGSSPAKPTFVLATVQTDFLAKDGSTELTVRVGDDVYLMFSIEGWAFATDLRDGSRRGYVPLSFCKAVEDFYVPAADDAPTSGCTSAAAVTQPASSSAAAKQQQQQPPTASRSRAACAAAVAEPIEQHARRPVLSQPIRPVGIKSCRVVDLASRAIGSLSTQSFDTVSCSSLEVSEIEADAEAPCPSVRSPAFSSYGSCSYSGSPYSELAPTATTERGLGGLTNRFGCLTVSERSAFRRPATSSSSSSSERDCCDDGAPSPADDCRQPPPPPPAVVCRYQKFSSRHSRPRFSSADASVQRDASAASSPNCLLAPYHVTAANSKDSGSSGRQSTSDEGYNSLVKYADTEAWRDRDDDGVIVDDDAVSTFSADYDSL